MQYKLSKFKNFKINLDAQTTFIICALIFLFSIFVRSVQDIGGDTGFYLELGKKIALGKRYYYDFFESNFPISFYIYALQYKISVLTKINPIIMSEIFVNTLEVLALSWSYQILKKSYLVKENKNYGNLLIISFCIAFFLRITALAIGEFGTKTSFLLILLTPYISYCFVDIKNLNKRNLVYRGILMGLIPCFKPHYLVIIIVIELYKFFEVKSLKFFITIDKLTALLILSLYLNFILIYCPEFFEFMVPMWSNFYGGYSEIDSFMHNILRISCNKILLYSLIAPVFLYISPKKSDKTYIAFFLGFSILLLLENISTIDQEAIFHFLVTAFILKIYYDFSQSKYYIFNENKCISIAFLLLPLTDPHNYFKSIFIVLSVWWVWFPALFAYFIYKNKQNSLTHKKIHFALYLAFTTFSILGLKYLKNDDPVSIYMISFIYFLFLYESAYKKQYHKCSALLIIVMFNLLSFFVNNYYGSIKDGVSRRSYFASPKKITDKLVAHLQLYAPKHEDGYLMFSNWIVHQFPLVNYLDKPYNFKYAIISLYDGQTQGPINKNLTMFSVKNKERGFAYNYLFDSVKAQINDKNLKVIFVNNMFNIYSKDSCSIKLLEYFFEDNEFKRLFFKNFAFKNRIIEFKDFDEKPKRLFKAKDKYEELEKSSAYLNYDFDVYVRK